MTAPTTPTGTLTDVEVDAALRVAFDWHAESTATRDERRSYRAGYAAGAANEAAIIRASLAQAEREDAAGQAHPQGRKPSTGLPPTLGEALADAHEWIEGRLTDQDFASGSLPVIVDAAQGQVSASVDAAPAPIPPAIKKE